MTMMQEYACWSRSGPGGHPIWGIRTTSLKEALDQILSFPFVRFDFLSPLPTAFVESSSHSLRRPPAQTDLVRTEPWPTSRRPSFLPPPRPRRIRSGSFPLDDQATVGQWQTRRDSIHSTHSLIQPHLSDLFAWPMAIACFFFLLTHTGVEVRVIVFCLFVCDWLSCRLSSYGCGDRKDRPTDESDRYRPDWIGWLTDWID